MFAAYYLDLCSHAIATPTEAYEVLRDYFDARAVELGAELLRSQMEEEVDFLVGEVEQDLRQRHSRTIDDCLQRESLEGRFRECLDAAWAGRSACESVEERDLGRGTALGGAMRRPQSRP